MIDSRAVIDPSATIAKDVSVGPFAVIGADVAIGAGTQVGPHVVIRGPTKIGQENRFFQFASVGEEPQDKKYGGEKTLLEIGDRNVIRECCTISRGTVQGGGITRIGNDNWIMAYVHIAHDCIVGNHTIFANSASLAGHVFIDDYAVLGGFTLVHQFCRIGAHSFTGMNSVLVKDVPPYVTVAGHPAKPYGLNLEGLKRRGFSESALSQIRKAYKLLYKSNLRLQDALSQIEELTKNCSELSTLAKFLETSDRGIVR